MRLRPHNEREFPNHKNHFYTTNYVPILLIRYN